MQFSLTLRTGSKSRKRSDTLESRARALAGFAGLCLNFILALHCSVAHAAHNETELIPKPFHSEGLPGLPFKVNSGTRISYFKGDADGKQTADTFAEWVEIYLKRHLEVVEVTTSKTGDIVFERAEQRPQEGPESYRLSITGDQVVVRGSDQAGALYGAVSLWQLMATENQDRALSLKPVLIEDKPRYKWRGLMLDSARHMQSVQYIKSLLDWMALHKLNRFHWHLTDDQGWRIEIPAFPKLTTVGAWRQAVGPDLNDDHVRYQGSVKQYGGYYTVKDIQSIVKYAQDRSIVVVPEIEMPGHATAAIAAYPELGTPGFDVPSPTPDWGLLPNLLNTNDTTVLTLNAILDDVMELFPGPYIHVGGDEVNKYQWHNSIPIQDEIKKRGLRNEEQLSSDFMRRIRLHIESKGRQLVGWDDILEGDIGKKSLIMSWRGQQGAIMAARSGVGAIMTVAPAYYLDNREVNTSNEPPGWTEQISLADVYGINPTPENLSAEEADKVIGVEGLIWTERARKENWVSALLFPRATAIAEAAWTPQSLRDVKDFSRRLETFKKVYPMLGISSGGQAVSNDDASTTENRISSLNLDFCEPGTVGLVVEGNGASEGGGELYKLDAHKPCWLAHHRDLQSTDHLSLSLAQIPFNFRLNASQPNVKLPPSQKAGGSIEIRLDQYNGPVLVSVPLNALAINRLPQKVEIDIPKTEGTHDLYFVLTGTELSPTAENTVPLTVINWIEFSRKQRVSLNSHQQTSSDGDQHPGKLHE